MTTAYDFVVAGSGAAGSAVAHRLVEGGARVLLVERGVKAAVRPDAMEAVYRYYTHGSMVAATGNCLLPIPTGSTVGGTTTINSGTCLKTPDEFLERWQSETSGGFQAEPFRARLDEAWRRLNVRTAPESTASRSSKLFLAGLAKLGVPGGHLLDRAEKGCVGSGRCCFVCPSGGKMTAEKAFLEPLGGREGFELAPGTELEWIDPPRRPGDPVWLGLREGGRARSVTCRAAVLAAGALATPYFVRRFGLGRRPKAAGLGLSVHPAAKIFALFDEKVEGWKGVPQGAGLVDPEEPRLRYEGVYTPPELAAITMPLDGRRLHWWMERYDHVATFGFMIRDASRGSVRHLGRSLPVIRYHMLDEDVRLMVRGMRFVGKALFAAGARRVVLPVNREPNVFDSPEALEADALSEVRASQLQMMAFHPLGTCGLGRVVDADLKLEEGVYACDGSVVPESLGVNPQITIYAFALRLAEHLLSSGGRS